MIFSKTRVKIFFAAAMALAACVLPPRLHAYASSAKKTPSLAGGVVRSEKWTIRRDKGEEEFEGNVSYHKDEYDFKSDWALYRKKQGHWQARGSLVGVRTWENGNRTECYGSRGEYFQNTGEGAVFSDPPERVRIVHHDLLEGTWQSFSDKALANEKESLLTLSGNVATHGDKSHSLSDTAVYDNTTSMITFTGGPPVVWGLRDNYTIALQARIIKVFRSAGDMKASGNVRGWFRDEKGTPKR